MQLLEPEYGRTLYVFEIIYNICHSLSIEDDLEELENFESDFSTPIMEPNLMAVSLDD